jgi:hypothetical protein
MPPSKESDLLTADPLRRITRDAGLPLTSYVLGLRSRIEKKKAQRPGGFLHPFPMRLSRNLLLIALAVSPVCYSQEWEVGGTGGYAWSINPSISNPNSSSVEAGFPARIGFGAIFAQNMYEHIGGELRYMLRFGGPQLQSQGVTASMTGYSNSITYDLMVHMASRDVKVRPFVSAGAGIRVYTGSGFLASGQPLVGYALLRPVTQVEPAIDLGAGVKWRVTKHVQLRSEFRVYMTPLPDSVFRTTGFSRIHGWVYDFAPQVGVSYVF